MTPFSVLLPVYKKDNFLFLEQSLSSIVCQTLMPLEIVIVKDGPITEELEAVLSRYAKLNSIIKIVSLPENKGLGEALNEGIKHCSYELIARMDADDIAKPFRFERQIEIFEKKLDVDIVGSWVDEFVNCIDNVVSIKRLPANHEEIKIYATKRCPMNHPTVMFKKTAVLAVGGYKHFPLLEDYYLWVRMLLNGSKFYNIQESLLYFRFSLDTIKRRGGKDYMKSELRLQNTMKKMKFISWREYLMNVWIRIFFRVIPSSLRLFLYRKVLR